jgi:hypothetical protein
MRGCGAGWVSALLAALLLAAAPARADTEVPLFTAERETCDIHGSATVEWRSVILRIANHAGATRACVVTQGDTLGLIGLAFDALGRNGLDAAGGEFRSIFLGRLTDYEWLSKQLVKHAERDAGWSSAEGRASGGERAEAYVQRSLEIPPILDPLDEVLKPYGYRAGGFSCEKAMISGPDTVPYQPTWVTPGKRLPFDALCHLVLKRIE